jgi:hypothetical protein
MESMEAVNSGRELIRFASSRQDNYRDTLLRIPGASRIVHVDCRPCTMEELESHCSLFALPVVDQNRWIHQRLQSSSLNEDFSARQPQASVIPKITLTPGASKFWKEPSRRRAADIENDLDLVFIAVVQGSGGSAVKKMMIATEFPQFASSLFQEAVNGFSIVFTGACLRQDHNKASDYSPGNMAVLWRKVATLDQMFKLSVRARPRDEGESEAERVIVGVLC